MHPSVYGDDNTPTTASSDAASPTAAPHPEEMKGTVTFSIGGWATVTATGRATPAGLASAALLAGAVLMPLAWALRRR